MILRSIDYKRIAGIFIMAVLCSLVMYLFYDIGLTLKNRDWNHVYWYERSIDVQELEGLTDYAKALLR